ncbi:MAG: hypothetical protein ACI9AD_000820 [Nitriliruptoraceae bacterium]|jgi:uncharacterized protein (DUF58 family)
MLLASFLLWLVGRILGISPLWMASVSLLGLVVAGYVWVLLSTAKLEAHRRIAPGRLFHEARAGVELTLRNTGRLPTSLLGVRDLVPDALTASAGFVLAPLRAAGVARLRYEIIGTQRGVYELGPVHVQLRDPFGVASRVQQVGSSDTLVVYPPVHRLAVGLPLRGLAGTGGASRPRPGATGEELSTVREYVQGDDLRKVHWGSTAHRGQLMIRQDESPQRPDATIVLDTRAAAHRGIGPAASIETATTAAASIAYHVAERGFDAALVTGATTSKPRPLPWQQTLERIARITPDDDSDLGALWQQLATTSGMSGLLFAVVCVPDAALLRPMVRAGRGASVRVALLVDADAHGSGQRRGPEPLPTARALRSAGWRVAVIGPTDNLATTWRELLAGGRLPAGASR